MHQDIKILNQLISFNECSGLNIDGDGSVKEILSSTGVVKSIEGDPQLLFTIKFRQNVNINFIQIESGMNKENIPEHVKIFVGKDDIDFDFAMDSKPTEKFDLVNNIGKQLKVNIPKFRNVNTMTIFFYSDEGDQIQVNSINFYGTANEGNVDFAEMKKKPVG